jgi:hypothetical protein
MNYEAPSLAGWEDECRTAIQSASKVEPLCSDSCQGQSTCGAYEVDE